MTPEQAAIMTDLASTPDPDGPPCDECRGGMAHYPECSAITSRTRAIAAKCGREDEHGAHVYLETAWPRDGRRSWCAGNRDIVTARTADVAADVIDYVSAHIGAVSPREAQALRDIVEGTR